MTARTLTSAPSAGCGGLAPYASYRESGLPWLGAIPCHWDVRRNGRLFAERVETGFEDLPILEVSLRTGVRIRDMENGARKQQMADRSKYKRAAKGDIAYNMMRMWQGAVGVAPEDGLISPAYVVARPFPEIDPRYYTYLFRTTAYMREVNKFSRGIVSDRNRLYWDEFKQMPSAFPPSEEQTRIADFLDDHGRRTSRLIRNKRRLIALLNEQKQAIINRAVTRGLNADTKLEPTGLYWMPNVPSGWQLKRFKFLASIRQGQVDPRLSEHKDRILIAPNHIASASGEIHSFESAQAQGADSGKYEVSAGDIVYSKIRPHLRKAAISPVDGLCSADMYPIRPNTNEVRPEFFLKLLLSHEFTTYAVDCSMRVAMPKINREALGDCWLAYPGIEEQREILDWIESQTQPLQEAKKRADQEIRLIHEYRERLIADVITGKLDVRHIEIAAPAEEPIADEDDALDEDLEAADTDELAEADD